MATVEFAETASKASVKVTDAYGATDKTKDPRDERKAARLERLRAEDPEFCNSFPDDEVVAAKQKSGLRLAQVVQIVMEGYADRPALGQRARELATDPATGRTTIRILPRFDTISFKELWRRTRATATEWHHNESNPINPGDFMCILGFSSPDYANILLAGIHRGAVMVPLQTSAPPAHQH